MLKIYYYIRKYSVRFSGKKFVFLSQWSQNSNKWGLTSDRNYVSCKDFSQTLESASLTSAQIKVWLGI